MLKITTAIKTSSLLLITTIYSSFQVEASTLYNVQSCNGCEQRQYYKLATTKVRSGKIYIADEKNRYLAGFEIKEIPGEPGVLTQDVKAIDPPTDLYYSFQEIIALNDEIKRKSDQLVVPREIANTAWDFVNDGGQRRAMLKEWLNSPENVSFRDKVVGRYNAVRMLMGSNSSSQLSIELKLADGGYVTVKTTELIYRGDMLIFGIMVIPPESLDGDKHPVIEGVPTTTRYTFREPIALDGFIRALTRAGIEVINVNAVGVGRGSGYACYKDGPRSRWTCPQRN